MREIKLQFTRLSALLDPSLSGFRPNYKIPSDSNTLVFSNCKSFLGIPLSLRTAYRTGYRTGISTTTRQYVNEGGFDTDPVTPQNLVVFYIFSPHNKRIRSDFMPTSFYHAIPYIIEEVLLDSPKSILDIGVGFGKFGVLLREYLEVENLRYDKTCWTIKIDGVEVFPFYKNPIYDYIYDKVYFSNILDIAAELSNYDTILMIDVLEHFEKDTGIELIKKLLNHTNKSLIVSTPLYPGRQGEYLGNPYEAHRSKFNRNDFLEFDFIYKLVNIDNNAAQIIKIYPSAKNTNKFDEIIENFNKSLSYNDSRKLKIGYILPHKNLTGGLKILLEQIKFLRLKGHKIYAYLRDNTKEVIPNWYNVKVDKEFIIPLNESFRKYVEECDIIILGFYPQMQEFNNFKKPVLYYEQGHELLFGDFGASIKEYDKTHSLLKNYYENDVYIASVSTVIQKLLKVKFGRESVVINNGIDAESYFPKEKKNDITTILLVGNPTLPFKGFDVALKVLTFVWNSGYKFKVRWVSQVDIGVQNSPFPIELYIKPSQEELQKIYRECDILLFTSWYEGFGLPPLEAMASGLAVVTTDCGGVKSFAKHGENCLMAEPGDVFGLANEIIFLLNNEYYRNYLAKKARETALLFDFRRIIDDFEKLLYYLVENHK